MNQASNPIQVDRHPEIEVLLQRYFEGTITQNEAETLVTFWDTSPEFDSFVRKNLAIEHILSLFVARKGTSDLYPEGFPFQTNQFNFDYLGTDFDELCRQVAEQAAQVEVEPISHENKTSYAPSAKSVSRMGFRRNALLLAVVMGVVFFAIYSEFAPKKRGQPPISSLARVVSVADPVFPDDAPVFKRNQIVGEEEIRLLSGLLEVELESGVRVVLEGETSFQVKDFKRSFCRQGKISVEVPKGAEGFEVKTPLMNIRDLGTEFVAEVNEEKCTVHVVKGKVAVDHLTSPANEVLEGIGMVAHRSNTIAQISADKKLFVDRSTMSRIAFLHETRRLSEWTETRQKRSADPEAVFYLNFEENDPAKGFVQKTGCRNADGRWNGKKAIAISRPNDVVKLSSHRRSDSFTLSASIRLNDLLKSNQTIFSIGDQERGALHWQITSLGEIQLLLGETESSLIGYPSKPVLSRRDVGVWIQLTTTLDADNRTVTHYIDGKSIVELPWKNPMNFDFSQACLGNWLRKERTPADRHLNGCIDEFIILDRIESP